MNEMEDEDYQKAELLFSHKARITVDVTIELRDVPGARIKGLICDYPENKKEEWLENSRQDQSKLLAALKESKYLNSMVAAKVFYDVGEYCQNILANEAEEKSDSLEKGYLASLDADDRDHLVNVDLIELTDLLFLDNIKIKVTGNATESLEYINGQD